MAHLPVARPTYTDHKPAPVKPRIILHGGAGNITRENLPPDGDAYNAYRNALMDILSQAKIALQKPDAAALDVATYTVTLLENNPLFNSGHGAVYTTAGSHELEASVMVSRGYRKRGVGVMKVTRVKNPILLAKEMLIRGEEIDGGGAGQHCQLHGEICDDLARDWGLEMVRPSYFWSKRRWDEHRKGLGLSHTVEEYEAARSAADQKTVSGDVVVPVTERECALTDEVPSARSYGDPSWDAIEYLPQGTVGCVVLDSSGDLCVATSTGGLTNKLPGRIGDTPTLGAGFWAEEWDTVRRKHERSEDSSGLSAVVGDCLPGLSKYLPLPSYAKHEIADGTRHTRGVAMSGTGNGDSFLRVNAVRTAAAIARYSPAQSGSPGTLPLHMAVAMVAGPNGQLQRRPRTDGKGRAKGRAASLALTSRMVRAKLSLTSIVVGCSGLGWMRRARSMSQFFRACLEMQDEPNERCEVETGLICMLSPCECHSAVVDPPCVSDFLLICVHAITASTYPPST
ncbi:N-terminal nucleophile aminohydrolase [Teratosphaeria destructans]|uniref:N-terminal nucleophile aminohydrolase n=1 Tax=Teratosphaeria destructans TaxID=418781 RepID=A0A9W7SII7_9PEZI|nr:N-terminal nucleophile aminohydrolase [Teratosphaeria destructans]